MATSYRPSLDDELLEELLLYYYSFELCPDYLVG